MPLVNIQLGEIIIGGVGAGLYGMLLFVIIAVFIAGLMVGRTPNISARRSRPTRSRWPCSPSDPAADVSRLDRGRRVQPLGRARLNNPGPHGFSEMLYAYSSRPATTARPSPGLPATRSCYNLTGAAWRCCVGRFMHDRADHGHGRLAWRKKKLVAGSVPARSRATGASFVGLLSASSCRRGADILPGAVRSGPLVEHYS